MIVLELGLHAGLVFLDFYLGSQHLYEGLVLQEKLFAEPSQLTDHIFDLSPGVFAEIKGIRGDH